MPVKSASCVRKRRNTGSFAWRILNTYYMRDEGNDYLKLVYDLRNHMHSIGIVKSVFACKNGREALKEGKEEANFIIGSVENSPRRVKKP